MAEPSDEFKMLTFERHLMKLINQPIIEFQEKNGLQISEIRIDLMNTNRSHKVKQVKQIIILYQ
jgi:hypothetical protein